MRFWKDIGHETKDEYLAFAGMVYAHRALSMLEQSHLSFSGGFQQSNLDMHIFRVQLHAAWYMLVIIFFFNYFSGSIRVLLRVKLLQNKKIFVFILVGFSIVHIFDEIEQLLSFILEKITKKTDIYSVY